MGGCGRQRTKCERYNGGAARIKFCRKAKLRGKMMSGVTDCLRVTLQKDGKSVNDGNIRLCRIGAARGARCEAMEA